MAKVREAHELPTAQQVREVLDYDAESGEFTWKPRPASTRCEKSWNGRWAGKRAGSQYPNGYWRISIFYQNLLAHRIAWLLSTGEWPRDEIDHIDRNTSNNRLANLRPANKSLNQANRARRKGNTSGKKGVVWSKANNAFVATIKVNGKSHYLGRFDTPEAAHVAYMDAAQRYFGQFARAA